jgi:hypothetical protein
VRRAIFVPTCRTFHIPRGVQPNSRPPVVAGTVVRHMGLLGNITTLQQSRTQPTKALASNCLSHSRLGQHCAHIWQHAPAWSVQHRRAPQTSACWAHLLARLLNAGTVDPALHACTAAQQQREPHPDHAAGMLTSGPRTPTLGSTSQGGVCSWPASPPMQPQPPFLSTLPIMHSHACVCHTIRACVQI